MSLNKSLTYIICSFVLGLGMLAAGYSLAKSLYNVKKMDRSITVKGLAEHDVISDLALWEINYREVGNDLIQVYQRILADQDKVVNFLQQSGFTVEEIEKTAVKVEDRLANIYSTNQGNNNQDRFVLTSGIRIRSKNVKLVQQSAQALDKLLQLGVPLTDQGAISPNPSFYFTGLDQIRPELMSAATKSALTIAKQFAMDAETQLVGVKRASQGVFQIMGRDTSTMNSDWSSNQNALGSIQKKVRLVTTIEYQIK